MLHRLAVVLSLLAATPARAGLVIEAESDGQPTTMYLEGNRLRIDTPSRHEMVIFDGDTQVLLQVDTQRRTFLRMDQATAARTGGEARSRLDEAMARMTPEQRARMKDALQSMGKEVRTRGGAASRPREWTYQPSGKAQTVAGLACQGYRALEDGKPESDVCLVPWGTAGVERSDVAALESLGKFLDGMMAAAASGLGRTAAAPRGDIARMYSSRLAGQRGFPVLVTSLRDAGHPVEWRVTHLERAAVPAGRFTLTPGLRQVDPMHEDDADD